MNTGFDLFVVRVLVPIACIIAIVQGFSWGLSEGRIALILAVVSLPLLFRLIGKPELFFIMVYVCISGNLTIPGIPQELMLRDVIAMGLIGLMFFRFLLSKPPIRKEFGTARLAGFALMAVIIVHIMVRGWGLRALSGELWGGMAYVRTFIAFGFFVASDLVLMTEKRWRQLFTWSAISSFFPGLAQATFIMSGGKLYQQYMFVRIEAWALRQSLYASSLSEGVVRYHFMSSIANAITMIGLTLSKWRYLPLVILISLPAALISGFRSALLIQLMILVLFAIFYSSQDRVKRLGLIMVTIFVGLLFLAPFARSLPLSFQRTLSIIPFYHISEIAREDAFGTVEWRVDIWRIMLKNIPDYLFIGRGFAAESSLYSTLDPSYASSPEFAYYVHNYHNGPLGMLLDLGIVGLISVTIFIVSSAIEAIKYKKLFAGDNFMNRYYCYLISVYLSQVIMFFVFFGDTISYVPSMMFSLALIKVIIRTRIVEFAAQEKEKIEPASVMNEGHAVRFLNIV